MSPFSLCNGGISLFLLFTLCCKGVIVLVLDNGDANLSSHCCWYPSGEISLVHGYLLHKLCFW